MLIKHESYCWFVGESLDSNRTTMIHCPELWNTRKGEIDARNAALDEAAALFDRKQSEDTPDQRTFNRHMNICKNEILALKQTKG